MRGKFPRIYLGRLGDSLGLDLVVVPVAQMINFRLMGDAVTVWGRFSDPTHIELSEPVPHMKGPVQVVVRPVSETGEFRSILGLGAKFGPAPSADEIDESRLEMWKAFPRDDIA